jgi:glycosyltransferase involved in cell wall biosynthesis
MTTDDCWTSLVEAPYPILHLLGSGQPGSRSFARIVQGLARGLDPERYRIHAWFLRDWGPVAEELQAAGASVRAMGWRGPRRDPIGTWRLWSALRRQECAIVHIHAGGDVTQWLASTATRARIILHLHALNTDDIAPDGFFPAPKRVRSVDAVIATSRAVADLVVGAQPHVVYPGVRIPVGNRFSGNRESCETVIGTACRLFPIKGLVYLIRAIDLLRSKFPSVRLEIAGIGPDRERLEREVRTLGLSERVVILGWQSDVETLLARWDLFVLPSVQEAFGIAVLEAMAAGLPVVASAVGGLRELVENGRTGWLVPPEDPRALAERIGMLLADPEQRRVLGQAGQSRARQHFSTDRMAKAIAAIYDGVLGLPSAS